MSSGRWWFVYWAIRRFTENLFILGLAWLSLWSENMITGRINQFAWKLLTLVQFQLLLRGERRWTCVNGKLVKDFQNSSSAFDVAVALVRRGFSIMLLLLSSHQVKSTAAGLCFCHLWLRFNSSKISNDQRRPLLIICSFKEQVFKFVPAGLTLKSFVAQFVIFAMIQLDLHFPNRKRVPRTVFVRCLYSKVWLGQLRWIFSLSSMSHSLYHQSPWRLTWNLFGSKNDHRSSLSFQSVSSRRLPPTPTESPYIIFLALLWLIRWSGWETVVFASHTTCLVMSTPCGSKNRSSTERVHIYPNSYALPHGFE